MVNFKVGDIVVAKGEYYGITCVGVRCEVLHSYEDSHITVKASYGEDIKNNVNYIKQYIKDSNINVDKEVRRLLSSEYRVESRYFKCPRVRNTALARKMYPEGEEKGEWLYV